MDENHLSHNSDRLSFSEVKLSFCKLCAYVWFGEIMANAAMLLFECFPNLRTSKSEESNEKLANSIPTDA